MNKKQTQLCNITTRLKASRKARGITQAELANRIGISRQSLSIAEAGQGYLSLCSAFRAARALGCDIEDIYSDNQFSGRPEISSESKK